MPRIKAPLSEERREQIRRWLDPNVPIDTVWREMNDPRRFGLAASTIQAVEYLISQNDAERLHGFLQRHSPEERAAIREYFEEKVQA